MTLLLLLLMRIFDTLAGSLWVTSLLGSFAYNFSQPGMKTSVKLIHARWVTHGIGVEFQVDRMGIKLPEHCLFEG